MTPWEEKGEGGLGGAHYEGTFHGLSHCISPAQQPETEVIIIPTFQMGKLKPDISSNRCHIISQRRE